MLTFLDLLNLTCVILHVMRSMYGKITYAYRYVRSASLSHSSRLISASWPWADSELQTQLSYVGGRPHLSHLLPLPSRRLDRYQFILLGDRGTWLWTACPGLLLEYWNDRESNPRPLDHKSNALTITPPSHPLYRTCVIGKDNVYLAISYRATNQQTTYCVIHIVLWLSARWPH